MTDTLFDAQPDIHRTAAISSCGQYRYRLDRAWDASLPVATFIMLNPSTADGETDDPTIRRCLGYARAWGCGALAVVNLYAFRATDPRDLMTADDPVGPDNDRYLTAAAKSATMSDGIVIAAWGTHATPQRIAQVLALPGMDQLTALTVTKAGHPGHPLYLKADLRPQPWRQP